MHHRSITAGHRPDQRPVARLPLTGPMTCTGDLVIKASTPAEQIGMQVPWDKNSYCRKRTLPKVQLVSFEIPEYNRMPTLISQNLSQKAVSESRTLANKVVRKSTRLHTCLHARHGAARPSTHSISRPRSTLLTSFPAYTRLTPPPTRRSLSLPQRTGPLPGLRVPAFARAHSPLLVPPR